VVTGTSDPLWWIITVATWVSIGTSVYFAVVAWKRNKRAWKAYDELYRRYRSVAAMRDRAMDRADWALNGIDIVLKWAGADDIPEGVVDRGHDPRRSVEESPPDGG
jgi:hypothetical protein